MKIRVIVPVTDKTFINTMWSQYVAAARPDDEISVVSLNKGPASLESCYEEALVVPEVLAKVRNAEVEGVDAVIIDCMFDPGLAPARELASIPIVGPAQTAMHLATVLDQRFSVVTLLERDIPLIDRLTRLYGLNSNLASVRPINSTVLELERDREMLVNALEEQSTKAVVEDGAHVIIFGCTGMIGLARQMEQNLAKKGYNVPVIDPSLAALKLAEGLVDMDLSHSKRTYPNPPPKEIIGYLEEGVEVYVDSRPGELRKNARIRVIISGIGEHWIVPVQEACTSASRPGAEISVVTIDSSPTSTESVRNEVLAVPGVMSRAQDTEAEGLDKQNLIDAVILDCMADPGLKRACDLASIPIVDPGQAAMHLAALLAYQFSIIAILEQSIPEVQRRIQCYGLEGKVASVRSINFSALDISKNWEKVPQTLVEESAKAVREDKAHLIVLDWKRTIGMAPLVRNGLADLGYEVPVIDPLAVAVKLAEGLVDIGLSQNKRNYPLPPDKGIIGYS